MAVCTARALVTALSRSSTAGGLEGVAAKALAHTSTRRPSMAMAASLHGKTDDVRPGKGCPGRQPLRERRVSDWSAAGETSSVFTSCGVESGLSDHLDPQGDAKRHTWP